MQQMQKQQFEQLKKVTDKINGYYMRELQVEQYQLEQEL
jgi:hypothetical protein